MKILCICCRCYDCSSFARKIPARNAVTRAQHQFKNEINCVCYRKSLFFDCRLFSSNPSAHGINGGKKAILRSKQTDIVPKRYKVVVIVVGIALAFLPSHIPNHDFRRSQRIAERKRVMYAGKSGKHKHTDIIFNFLSDSIHPR